MYGLFLFNRHAITDSILIIRNERMARETAPPALVQPPPVVPLPVQQMPPPLPPAAVPVAPPAAQPPAPQEPPVAVSALPVQPPAQPAPVPAPAAALPSPAQVPAELRERALHFIQIDRSGAIFRIRVNRNLPLSNYPMTDTLRALVDGPSADESRRGLISLIPPGTRVISAAVRGGTAYINFSEDFRYNSYGVEGYFAQLRQIIYTVTEFPNVRDVQILIEGRPVDFLGEGIWVGSPIGRGF